MPKKPKGMTLVAMLDELRTAEGRTLMVDEEVEAGMLREAELFAAIIARHADTVSDVLIKIDVLDFAVRIYDGGDASVIGLIASVRADVARINAE